MTWEIKSSLYLFLFSGIASVFLHGQTDLMDKLRLLREKSKSHQNYIDSILENGSRIETNEEFKSENFSTTSGDEIVPDSLQVVRDSELPEEDTFKNPEFDENKLLDGDGEDFERRAFVAPQAGESIEVNFENQDTNAIEEQYENLYKASFPERRLGYYFGPFFGFAFPDDLSEYQAKNGTLFGLRLGRDFGWIRTEGEYSFLSHEIEQTGDSKLHNFFSRFILENELGDQADLRFGLGLGLSSVSIPDADQFGFAYDFLIGWSYRVSNNWSICLDYRYYLTAASKDISRSKGHILEIGTNFDL